MFRRFRNTDDDPIANQLRDSAEPNVLHLDGNPPKPERGKSGKSGGTDKSAGPARSGKSAKSAKSGKSGKPGKSAGKGLEWTPEDEPAVLEPFEEELDESDEDDEEDERTAEQRRADLEAELQREAEEFGLANLSPVSLYGPNGEAVVALLDSLIDIDDDTAEAIAEAFDAVPDAERKVSRSFVRRNLRKWALEAEVETAEQAVNDWLSSLKVDYEYEAVYADVADAARDAVAALTLEDELDDADFDTLYGPWSEVMDSDEDEAVEDEHSPAAGAAKGAAVAAKGAAGAKTPAGAAKSAAGTDVGDAEEVGEFGPSTPLVIEFLGKLTALETAEIGFGPPIGTCRPSPAKTPHGASNCASPRRRSSPGWTAGRRSTTTSPSGATTPAPARWPGRPSPMPSPPSSWPTCSNPKTRRRSTRRGPRSSARRRCRSSKTRTMTARRTETSAQTGRFRGARYFSSVQVGWSGCCPGRCR